mgnify:CR=1 FL=1
MAFRHGFKSQCERRSIEIRRRLGLRKVDALSAFDLASYLGITVWSVKEIEGLSNDDILNLNVNDDDSWSALTMRVGAHFVVVYKNVSSVARINSVVMHEVSHILLGHELAEACILEDGSFSPSHFSQSQEDEADWLAGTLLLPRPALMHIRKLGLTEKEAQKMYAVSERMLNWRIRMTGIDYQLGRRRRKQPAR